MDLDFSSDILEKLLLKRALVDKKWLGILSSVYDKRWFKVPNIATVMKLIINFYNKYGSIPNTKVISALVQRYIEKSSDQNIKLSEVQSLLQEINSLNFNLNDDILTSNLKEFIRRNAFYNSLFDNAELLERSPDNYSKVVDKCLENFDRVQKITFSDADLGMNYFSQTDQEKHWDYINNPEAKISTGWQGLDHYTNGGLLKSGKMLAVFAGQAGLGKSLFLSNITVNLLKQNLSVVVISLEMSQDVYATRFDAHISNSNINQLKENQETAIDRIKTFYQKYPKANLFIKEYPPRSIKTADIQNYLENLKNEGHHIDVIVIDYLNLVLPRTKSDNMYKDGLMVSEELRALSYEFSVPVITATQVNSEGMNNESVGMENISESRGIAHTADFIGALYQTDDDRENSIINMRIIKNRLGGQVGKVCNFKLNSESLVVSDLTFDPSLAEHTEDSEIGDITRNLPDITSELLSL